VPFFGLRIGIRATLAIIIAAAVFLFLKPIKTLYINEKGFWEANYGDGIIMVYIPGGEFTMGSNDFDDEKPIHTVYLDGYWMGKYEITIKQYMKFVNATKTHYPEWLEQGNKYNINTGADDYYKEFLSNENNPIVGISWNDANAYCDWLSTEKNLIFKLPTESQWEKAARGTDSRTYPWGNSPPSGEKVNFADIKLLEKEKIFSWVDKNIDDGYAYTAPVGSYHNGASPYGLLDMAGNVWEWCYDWYDIYSAEPQKNPTGPESGSNRVVRGGGWLGGAGYLRCANRSYHRPSNRVNSLGFRLCQDNR
ncbi:MAG: SUMF1/EgtB/PvdO family nonheme iron enzyme, partial [Candidatus Aminicenantes bacterium]|nr:SUMF1/EgtB/PvdO family nonheme iron enzyme [Candidatus Aminicenantes bacterium]NIM82121.1 SUMF1/EgtB/PvdO family nonheme iron enzyme [Candidatus Aminicenantes bacterium]NIN21514.1 SUMF1/EgtB/PvdO family nonheme iron enzyme [Candidatus Aminicenantes bacterium]NIN45325.1 SUMF1/EgtB/PvdO family nonheme iron enzyme [Candidatus Aminicenantes bacterium]NIN88145.1 SUMF1/EgtB/PvdO family nonheme iron enzyme [Candidatus Aminicenantes bacterium]